MRGTAKRVGSGLARAAGACAVLALFGLLLACGGDDADVGGTMAQEAYLKPAPNLTGAHFGTAVTLSRDGRTFAAGAPEEGDAAYVFVLEADGWSQQTRVTASDAAPGGRFGAAIALSSDGDTLAVGAPSAAGVGSVHLFVRSGGRWQEQARLRAPDPQGGASFGAAVALSDDGRTLAVGAWGEAVPAPGVGADDIAFAAGAAYVFVRTGSTWVPQARLIAPVSTGGEYFGYSVALSTDGGVLAVGAPNEGSAATGIDGDPADRSASFAGAAYVFAGTPNGWQRQAYVKASNAGAEDHFGTAIALSADGRLLVVGARGEASAASGIDGDQTDDSSRGAGAAYVFARVDEGGAPGPGWQQQAYLKASVTYRGTRFGSALAVSGDGRTLAVGAWAESSGATGIDGDQTDFSAPQAGAVYLFRHDGRRWTARAYVKASNAGEEDRFGSALALNGDGSRCAVGAPGEAGAGSGIEADPSSNAVPFAGAAYVFR